ncbi:uncharacterized protein LOC130730125 [Lotus japonicus]|uniref:uncharacterized protein LOC130730125 n=1 Tax=Lotus japonicus TaxID=34305 RepID=UPI00258BB806|nr:uncharacterized protein LOC130730125 [Lotus japonicus]
MDSSFLASGCGVRARAVERLDISPFVAASPVGSCTFERRQSSETPSTSLPRERGCPKKDASPIPQKCILLIWLASHDALPTNECRFKRCLTPSSECVLCHDGDETVLHCLRDCRVAKELWNRVGFAAANPLFLVQDQHVWLRELLGDSDPLASAAIWWIWRVRYHFCLENTLMNHFVVASSITNMARDIQSCFGISNAGPSSSLRLVRWHPRNHGRLVLNVDGSVRDNPSRGGFGGCLRGDLGQWLGGFYGFRDDLNILYLELLAIFYGLSMVWDRGDRNVECQSDSLDAVTLVISRIY